MTDTHHSEPPDALHDAEPPADDYEPPVPHINGTRAGADAARQPHDINAERYVLGAALVDEHALDDCARLVTAADFYHPTHERIWRSLTHLRADEQPTGPTAVVAHLIDTHQVGPTGVDPAYVFDLYSRVDVPEHGTHYAGRVDQLARRRRGLAAVRQAVQRLEQPGPDTDIDQALAETAQLLNDAHQDLGNPPATTSWSPVDLTAVLAGEHLDPPPTMLMRDDGVFLLYDGAVHTVSGESESGKTWLTLHAAVQLLAQGDRVVFLDFEDRADRVVGRLLGLGATLPQIAASFAYIRPDRPLDDDGRAQLAPALADARLVVVDGVTEAMTMHGFEINDNADSATFQAMLPRWIADHGPAVVMIDHVTKDKETQGRFAIGAQHKLAGIDGAAYIVKTILPFGRGKRGIARVDVAKDRPGHVREHTHGKTIAEFALDARNSDTILTAELTPPGPKPGTPGSGDTWEPTILMEKISRAVQLTPGMGKSTIEQNVPGKTAHKRTALELLALRGYIEVRAETRGKIGHYHVKPYWADPDQAPDDDEHDGEPTP